MTLSVRIKAFAALPEGFFFFFFAFVFWKIKMRNFVSYLLEGGEKKRKKIFGKDRNEKEKRTRRKNA